MSSSRVSQKRDPQRDDLRLNREVIKRRRADFFINGENIHTWAKAHNYSPTLVYSILRGERRCSRGKSHEIAVKLGLKNPHANKPAKAAAASHRLNAEVR